MTKLSANNAAGAAANFRICFTMLSLLCVLAFQPQRTTGSASITPPRAHGWCALISVIGKKMLAIIAAPIDARAEDSGSGWSCSPRILSGGAWGRRFSRKLQAGLKFIARLPFCKMVIMQ